MQCTILFLVFELYGMIGALCMNTFCC